MNAFILQECIKLIRSDSQDVYNGAKDLYFKFDWNVYSPKNPAKKQFYINNNKIFFLIKVVY